MKVIPCVSQYKLLPIENYWLSILDPRYATVIASGERKKQKITNHGSNYVMYEVNLYCNSEKGIVHLLNTSW